MGRGTSKASRSGGHPTVTDVNAFDSSPKGKKDFIRSAMPGVSEDDIPKYIKAADSYTSTPLYSKMHLGTGAKAQADRLNALIDSPNSPVYAGDTFRGMHIPTDSIPAFEEKLKTGRWTESGISSFSAKESVAEHFTTFQLGLKNRAYVIIKNVGHSKGMPAKHLSRHTDEDEVIMSSSTMRKGMKILDTKKETDSKGRIIYHITVDDRK